MPVTDQVKAKLSQLPDKPGVYLMRDRSGRIIYVGKAASLRSRVRHYFQPATLRSAEPKLRGLINSIVDLDFLVVRTEAEAILTEGRMIKEYRPRYNVAFRDDKRFPMLRVDLNEPWPRVETCRMDKRDGALYFGPYSNSIAARVAREFLDQQFKLRVCPSPPARCGGSPALPCGCGQLLQRALRGPHFAGGLPCPGGGRRRLFARRAAGHSGGTGGGHGPGGGGPEF
jgi:excinuclease UvrABC nuclease subunit